MPIIDKPQPGAPSAQVDDHASEAAKMRRTREQAYFNSYDFDAIEVLPYDEDEHTHNRTTSRHSKWQQRPRQRQQQPMSPHNQPRPPTATQTLPPHSPSLGRRRLQQHSAATLGSSGSGSAASSRSSSSRQQRIKYSYLQRLGAFFGSDAQVHNEVDVDVDAASSSGGSSRGVAEGVIGGGGGGGAGDLLQQQQQQQHELTIMGSDPAMVENANFLLPRAMLKYQGIVGNANSMPLAVLSSPYSTGASNGSSNNNNNNNNNNTKSAKSTPTPSATSTLLAAAVATTPTANSPTSRPSKNRQSQLGRDEHGTGFPPTTSTTTTTTLKTATTTMSTAMPTSSSLPGKSSTLARNKKKSTGSTTASTSPPHVVVVANSSTPTTATTTTMVPPTAVDRKLAENVVDTMGVRKGSGQQAKMAKTTNTTISTANTVISMPTMKTKSTIDRRTLTKTAATKAPATTTISTTTKATGPSTLLSEVQVEPRERIGSHQSHYSTDKSGSSGYYSSNVCSTYSIEEHIYCEPVVDVLDANTKSGSSSHTLANNKKPINSDHNYNQNHNNHNYQNHNHNKQSTTTKTVTTTSLGRKLDQGEKLLHRTKVMNGEGSRVDGDGGGGDTGVGDDGPDDEDGGGRRGGCGGLGRTLDDQLVMLRRAKSHHQPSSSATATAFGPFSENLRILETSIENLDRHLKAFPSLSSQERIASFMQSHHGYFPHGGGGAMDDKLRPYHQLPTIMEGYDSIAGQQQQQQRDADGRWPEVAMTDDSLLDIDLDSFLLVDERKAAGVRKSKKTTSKATEGGIDNPSFLAEELEENHYKCAKYINSCPEDAYRVDSDIVVVHGHGNGSSSETATGSASQKSSSMEHFVKRYEDQIHFQNTRELLEDVRDKIRLLSQSTTTTTTTSNSDLHSSSGDSERRSHSHNQAAAQAQAALDAIGRPTAAELPKELEGMIKTLKLELEAYLDRMNQHSELEIRQLCSGLVKNQHIVRMKKAFERRRSIASLSALDSEYDFSAYEAIRDGVLVSASGVPLGIRQQITSIRCASDPNFKMKRKSLTEVFPVVVDCYGEGGNNGISNNIINSSSGVNINNNNVNNNALVAVGSTSSSVSASASSSVSRSTSSSLALAEAAAAQSQLQRNLSFHQPILNQLDSQVGPGGGPGVGGGGGSASGGSAGDSGDKDSIMEWHRQKPSIWELYYGTNRMSQSLLGKRGVIVNTNQAAMSYPSSRPESDFTLDLPRAEQLRIKMEKEKKFRQRCRYITSFLSLVFFLLTVMVVSLVLTRGKRMFGSMI